MTTLLTRVLPGSRPSLPLIGLLLVPAGVLVAQDAEFLGVLKSQNFRQDSPLVVSLADEDFTDPDDAPMLVEAFADASFPNLLTSGTLARPSGPDVSLFLEGGGETLIYLEGFEVFSEMNDAFPDGSYTMNLVGVNDGARSATVDLSGSTYPGLTRITNFAAAQDIDAASDFTFQWGAIPGGVVDDLVLLCIEDDSGEVIFETPNLGEAGALTGLSISALVPGGTLDPGTEYEVFLEAFRPVDFNESYAAGVLAVGVYGKSITLLVRTAGGVDSDSPNLDRTAPFPFQSGVELNTIVTFEFDEAMDTSIDPGQAINWSGVSNPGLFAYLWSPDGKTLFCNYAPGLPASATVQWTLNAAGSAAKLRDAAGNNLPAGFSGEFETSATSNLGVPDVESIGIVKARAFYQEGATSEDLGLYFAELFVGLNGISTVSSVDLGIPGVGVEPNAVGFEFSFDEIDGEADFAEKADLDAIFPNGSYAVTLHTVHDGDKTVMLNTGPADNYPNAPTIQNFATTQAWDSSQPFTLEWDAMAGGTSADLIVVFLEGDRAFFYESPDIGEPGVLDGTATSVVIPANTLPPGRTLIGELLFAKIVANDTNQYPGARGIAAFVTITEFEVQTTGDPIEPQIEVDHDGGQATVTVIGERGRSYELRSSENLQNWTPRFRFTLFDESPGFQSSFDFFDNVGGIPQRFYQAEEVFFGP